MSAWLKLIGTAGPNDEWDYRHYKRDSVDFARNRRPRRMHPGDDMVLYAVGGSKRLFALAKVTSEAYENGEYERWPYRVDIRYLVNLPVSDGVHIDEINSSERELVSSLKRASYIELRPEEFRQAASKLRLAASEQ